MALRRTPSMEKLTAMLFGGDAEGAVVTKDVSYAVDSPPVEPESLMCDPWHMKKDFGFYRSVSDDGTTASVAHPDIAFSRMNSLETEAEEWPHMTGSPSHGQDFEEAPRPPPHVLFPRRAVDDHEGEIIAVARDGTARFIPAMDYDEDDDEEVEGPLRRPLVLVHPDGRAFYVPKGESVDWEVVCGPDGTEKQVAKFNARKATEFHRVSGPAVNSGIARPLKPLGDHSPATMQPCRMHSPEGSVPRSPSLKRLSKNLFPEDEQYFRRASPSSSLARALMEWKGAVSPRLHETHSLARALNEWKEVCSPTVHEAHSLSRALNEWKEACSPSLHEAHSLSRALNEWKEACSPSLHETHSLSRALNEWKEVCSPKLHEAHSLSRTLNEWKEACSPRVHETHSLARALTEWKEAVSPSQHQMNSLVRALHEWREVCSPKLHEKHSLARALSEWKVARQQLSPTAAHAHALAPLNEFCEDTDAAPGPANDQTAGSSPSLGKLARVLFEVEAPKPREGVISPKAAKAHAIAPLEEVPDSAAEQGPKAMPRSPSLRQLSDHLFEEEVVPPQCPTPSSLVPRPLSPLEGQRAAAASALLPLPRSNSLWRLARSLFQVEEPALPPAHEAHALRPLELVSSDPFDAVADAPERSKSLAHLAKMLFQAEETHPHQGAKTPHQGALNLAAAAAIVVARRKAEAPWWAFMVWCR